MSASSVITYFTLLQKRTYRPVFTGKLSAVAEQQLVKVQQLAALALPPHPDAFLLVVGAVPVEQEEGSLVLAPAYFAFSASIMCAQSVASLSLSSNCCAESGGSVSNAK